MFLAILQIISHQSAKEKTCPFTVFCTCSLSIYPKVKREAIGMTSLCKVFLKGRMHIETHTHALSLSLSPSLCTHTLSHVYIHDILGQWPLWERFLSKAASFACVHNRIFQVFSKPLTSIQSAFTLMFHFVKCFVFSFCPDAQLNWVSGALVKVQPLACIQVFVQ
jgi:hypothetical protein